MRARDVRDHSLVDWLYGPTALSADQLPPMFSTVDRPEPDSSSGLAPPRRLVGTRPPTWHE
jgi:salicylate hydroxylase